MKTFMEDYLNKNATLNGLDSYVDYWLDNNTGKSLQKFLGMTDYEYEYFLHHYCRDIFES